MLFEIPWFVIPKRDSDNWRFITNLRQLNRQLRLKRFSLDTWRSIFPMLRKNQYACKVDLKDACLLASSSSSSLHTPGEYFHVPLSIELQRYVCVRFRDEVFQFLAMPFNISVAPAVWTSVMDVCAAIWLKHGLLVYLYFDNSILTIRLHVHRPVTLFSKPFVMRVCVSIMRSLNLNRHNLSIFRECALILPQAVSRFHPQRERTTHAKLASSLPNPTCHSVKRRACLERYVGF